ncbi:hypothetical protein BJY00DRAFT_112133 [Aspergillus carlsbadensis]|nr:hypothetical protein BJY00DRAFT_112133 [Aspergillus carlsbadensis]
MADPHDPDRGFLEGVASPAIQTSTYATISQLKKDFHDALDNPELQYLLLSNVTTRIFTTHFRDAGEDADDDDNDDADDYNYDYENPCTRWTAYDPSLELLLVQTPTSKIHGCAREEFSTRLVLAMDRLGVFGDLLPLGSGACHAALGSKCADKAYRPMKLPLGRSAEWPSMVVEVEITSSDTASKLESDVRYWARAPPAGEVRIIVTIRVSQSRPEIALEKWEDNHEGRKERCQTITIRHGVEGKKPKVEGGPMVLDFEKLFLRPPATPMEQEVVVLSEEDLALLATHVWITQSFVPWEEV